MSDSDEEPTQINEESKGEREENENTLNDQERGEMLEDKGMESDDSNYSARMYKPLPKHIK